VKIQTAWRSYVFRRQQRELLQITLKEARDAQQRAAELERQLALKAALDNRAAAKIQSAFRGFTQRRHFLSQRSAAIVLQTYTRGYLARQYFSKALSAHRERQRLTAAIRLQAVVRGYRARQEVIGLRQRYNDAATIIQKFWYGYQTMRVAQAEYHLIRRVVIKAQRLGRKAICKRVATQNWSATVIQAYFRGYVQRVTYKRQVTNAITIQCAVRQMMARKQLIALKAQRAALEMKSATTIQCAVRQMMARKQLIALKAQRAKYLAQLTLIARRNLGVIMLQRKFRHHLAYVRAQRSLEAVVRIQTWMRGRLVRLAFLRTVKAVAVLQRAGRAYIRNRMARKNRAAIIIQRATRAWLERLDDIRRERSARLIQRMWRGFKVRRDATKKMAAIRERVIVANANVTEEMKLGNRSKSALEILLTHKQLTFVLRAVENLDAVTRLSHTCCERLVQHDAVPIIFQLIRSCNRSKPHMAVLVHALRILVHLGRCKTTIHAVFSEGDAISMLVELLQMYRDKKDIFVSAAQLLVEIAKSEKWGPRLRSDAFACKRIKSIHSLLMRKKQMDTKLSGGGHKEGSTNLMISKALIDLLN
jgi:abnormal spindle-like microcephaly-associated protein